MNKPSPPVISVLLATRNRSRDLARALETLARAATPLGEAVEVLLIDNGSTDSSALVIENFFRQTPVAGCALSVGERGKARALNRGLQAARGEVLAFTDDDVEVPPGWLSAAYRFACEDRHYAAATGPVRLPPHVHDREILERVRLLRTLPLFDLGPSRQETKHLYGCNMVVRRQALERIGGFDERLGPGASGLHEDGDVARRLRAAGERILYLPELEMFHTVDPERLTWEFFVALHHADARSRFVRDGNRGLFYALRHWLGAVFVWSGWLLLGNRARRTRAYGRLVYHAEYARLAWQTLRRHARA